MPVASRREASASGSPAAMPSDRAQDTVFHPRRSSVIPKPPPRRRVQNENDRRAGCLAAPRKTEVACTGPQIPQLLVRASSEIRTGAEGGGLQFLAARPAAWQGGDEVVLGAHVTRDLGGAGGAHATAGSAASRSCASPPGAAARAPRMSPLASRTSSSIARASGPAPSHARRLAALSGHELRPGRSR